MTEEEKFQREFDHLKRQMQYEEEERTWRDREVTAADAQRALRLLCLQEELLRSGDTPLTRAVGRVKRRLEALEAALARGAP